MVVYIAGPYRAPTISGVLANIGRAREAALAVWKAGAVALCPHLNTALFDGEADDSVWLEGDLVLMRRCDAVLAIDGWRRSTGASLEVECADKYGIRVHEMRNGKLPQALLDAISGVNP